MIDSINEKLASNESETIKLNDVPSYHSSLVKTMTKLVNREKMGGNTNTLV